jgi:hypothetical protein
MDERFGCFACGTMIDVMVCGKVELEQYESVYQNSNLCQYFCRVLWTP